MRCYECGGLVRDAKVDFVLPVGGDEVIVTGVPAHVCVRCGEEILDLEVVQNLEHIRDLIIEGALQPERKPVGSLAYAFA